MDKQYHARALRVIGQQLAVLFPQDLLIEVEGNDFVAKGQCMAKRLNGTAELKENGSKRASEKPGHRTDGSAPVEAQSSIVSFKLRYTLHDIKKLDDVGFTRRAGAGRTPDIYSLGELLRTVGRIVDAKGGRLIRLEWDLHTVTFEYFDVQGNVEKEEHSSLALYRSQREYYSERGTGKSEEPWGGKRL